MAVRGVYGEDEKRVIDQVNKLAGKILLLKK